MRIQYCLRQNSSRLNQFVKSRQHERIYKNSKKFPFFEKKSYFCLFVLYTFRISRAILNTLVAKKLHEDQCIFRTIFAMGYKVLRRKIIMSSTNLTGKPSVDRPWLQYYPEPLRKITVPECTVKEYLKMNCPVRMWPRWILWQSDFVGYSFSEDRSCCQIYACGRF